MVATGGAMTRCWRQRLGASPINNMKHVQACFTNGQDGQATQVCGTHCIYITVTTSFHYIRSLKNWIDCPLGGSHGRGFWEEAGKVPGTSAGFLEAGSPSTVPLFWRGLQWLHWPITPQSLHPAVCEGTNQKRSNQECNRSSRESFQVGVD